MRMDWMENYVIEAEFYTDSQFYPSSQSGDFFPNDKS